MNPFINRDHVLLELRVEELEGHLAALREEIREIRAQVVDRADGAAGRAAPPEVPFGRRASDAALTAIDGPDGEREGARLVVLEMLSSGYTQEQIATYLRQTFGVDDPETLMADAVPVAD